jgi:ribosomal protein S18 acetylase RimI-like enzyme
MVTIHAATTADIPSLAELWYEKTVMRAQADHRIKLAPNARAVWTRSVIGWLDDPNCRVFVAVESVPVGYLLAWVQPARRGTIQQIAIDAHGYHGGVGRALVEAARAWFTDRGVARVVVWTARRDATEQAFWRSLGATDWMEMLWMDVGKFLIRQATARDIDAIAHLWEALVKHHQTLDTDLPGATPQGAVRYGRRIIDRLDDPTARVLVAEVPAPDGTGRGQVVGYVLGLKVDLVPEMFAQEAGGFLADIFVAPDHRRKGVGRALVDGLTEWFRAEGLHYFEWHVAARNADAVAFWRSMGGREVMLRMRANLDE